RHAGHCASTDGSRPISRFQIRHERGSTGETSVQPRKKATTNIVPIMTPAKSGTIKIAETKGLSRSSHGARGRLSLPKRINGIRIYASRRGTHCSPTVAAGKSGVRRRVRLAVPVGHSVGRGDVRLDLGILSD